MLTVEEDGAAGCCGAIAAVGTIEEVGDADGVTTEEEEGRVVGGCW